MGHTYTQLYYHCVFSTSRRRPLLRTPHRQRIHAYMGGIMRKPPGMAITIGGADDHVHILCSLHQDAAVSAAMREVKAKTTAWIHNEFPTLGDFAWQQGYGAFTVSRSNLDQVANYIREQQAHHRKMTFEEEFIHFLRRHDVAYDPRYVFD